MTTPDTTEAVAEALDDIEQFYYYNGTYRLPANTYEVAHAAIAADRKALADAGYVIVKRETLDDYIGDHADDYKLFGLKARE